MSELYPERKYDRIANVCIFRERNCVNQKKRELTSLYDGSVLS